MWYEFDAWDTFQEGFPCIRKEAIENLFFHQNTKEMNTQTLKLNVRIILLPVFFLLLQGNISLEAQTRIFRGTESNLWDNPFNWEPFGLLPVSTEDVVIDPTGPHTDVQMNIDVNIRSLEVKSGTLTVPGGRTLTVSNSTSGLSGIKITTSLTNTGTINVNDTGEQGVLIHGTLTNSGIINVNNAGEQGVLTYGTFINFGTVSVGQGAGSIGKTGVHIEGTGSLFTNDGGTIGIDNTGVDGWMTPGSGIWLVNAAMFDNKNGGQVLIGQNGGKIRRDGITIQSNNSVFKNTNGTVSIDNTGFNSPDNGDGLRIWPGGSFLNEAAGQVLIGQGAGNIRLHGILCYESGFFTNNGGLLRIDNTWNNTDGHWGPFIALGGSGPKGTFTNKNGGQVLLGQTNGVINGNLAILGAGLFENLGCNSLIHIFSDDIIFPPGLALGPFNENDNIFFNEGVIIENATGTSTITTNQGIIQNLNGGTFNIREGNPPIENPTDFVWQGCVSSDWSDPANWYGGAVPLDGADVLIFNSPHHPVIDLPVALKSMHVLPNAELTIETNGTLGINAATAVGLLNEGTILNLHFISIGTGTPSGADGIQNLGVFTNTACADLYVSDNLSNGGDFTNDGYARFTTSKVHTNTGTFTNNGLLHHQRDNPIPSVINNEIIIQPTTANSCSDISPAFELGSPLDYTITHINFQPASRSSDGHFDALSNTFSPNSPLEEGTHFLYVWVEMACQTVEASWQLTTQNCCDLPEAFCLSYEAVLDENGLASITAADVDGGSTADCGLQSLGIDVADFDCSQLGTYQPVELTVTDINGDSDQCTTSVYISGLPCGFSAPADGVNCAGGNQADYDPDTDIYTITSEGCYDPSYYSATDALGYIGTTLCGDGEVIAQVTQVVGNGWAGITMREGSSSSDKMLQLMIDGVSMSRRELRQSSGGTAFAHQFPTQGKNWLRLTRTGNTFGAYHSADGINWQAVLITNIPMTNCIEVGMITANSSPSGSMTATFENFEVISLSTLQAPNVQGIDIAHSSQPTLEVYPNPAKGEAWIRFNQLIDQGTTIEVYNNMGQRIYEVPNLALEEQRIRLDVAGWLPGMYLIQLKAEGQPVVSKKLIVSD